MMYILFILLAVIVLIALKPKKKTALKPKTQAQKQGKKGEELIQQHYCESFCQKTTVMLNDCTFLMKNQHTTQIDHVLINHHGIFVLETKNYQGWIFGSERQKQWTVCLGPKKFQFQNPIHQNYLHVKTLQELLSDDIASQHIYSVVSFVGKSEFKTDMPVDVCQGEQWINYVKSFKTSVLSNQQIQHIAKKLEKIALVKGHETDCKHIESLQKRHARKRDAA